MANNTASRGMVNYLNTLIFCIIAKAVTVFLLVALLFESMRKYSYLILTVEVCLIAIIAISLYRITQYEKKKAKDAEKTMSSKVAVTTCPDYFVKSMESNNATCKKEYTTPNGRLTYIFTGYNSSNNINLDKDFQNKDLKGLCVAIAGSSNYANIAWTDIKGKCAWI